jgi:hypothetical protein
VSRTFAVVRDIASLPTLMRQAIDPATAPAPLYEIRDILSASPGPQR